MNAKLLIDNLLLEMPQYRLIGHRLSSELKIDTITRLHALGNVVYYQGAYFTLTASVVLTDDRSKTLRKFVHINLDRLKELGISIHAAGLMKDDHVICPLYGGGPLIGAGLGDHGISEYIPELANFENDLVEKLKAWASEHDHPGFVNLERIPRIITGLKPSLVVDFLKDVKYVWISGEDDPSESAELLSKFSQEVGPGETLYRISTHKVSNQFSRSASIYAFMTDDQKAKFERNIVINARKRVAKVL